MSVQASTPSGLELWQEFDCQSCGIDYDLEQLAIAGQAITCPGGCDRVHVAGVDGPTETIARDGRGRMRFLGLPVDEAQRSAWLSGDFGPESPFDRPSPNDPD